MITILTVIVILIVGYAQMREGLFTAFCMLVNIILAGVVAFGFFEPFADKMEPSLAGGFMAGFEDFLALLILFAVTLIVLRVITNKLAPEMLAFDGNVQYGGALLGLVSGYLLSGFLICAMETLPWHENFLDFQPRTGNDTGPRSIFPPDRVWLAMMRHAGANPLAWEEDDPSASSNYDRYLTFDRHATFEQRYLRYRRHGETRPPLEYKHELDREIGR
jgi:uncharacterized membrane protein required for colicin V production